MTNLQNVNVMLALVKGPNGYAEIHFWCNTKRWAFPVRQEKRSGAAVDDWIMCETFDEAEKLAESLVNPTPTPETLG